MLHNPYHWRIAVDIYHQIYTHLLIVIPDLKSKPTSGKSIVQGFMDLSYDYLTEDNHNHRIALSHFYKQNGDLVPDPDMEIRVNFESETAEALTYQDTYRYDEVYDGENVDIKLKESLNEFLLQWLKNLIEQGHKIL